MPRKRKASKSAIERSSKRPREYGRYKSEALEIVLEGEEEEVLEEPGETTEAEIIPRFLVSTNTEQHYLPGQAPRTKRWRRKRTEDLMINAMSCSQSIVKFMSGNEEDFGKKKYGKQSLLSQESTNCIRK